MSSKRNNNLGRAVIRNLKAKSHIPFSSLHTTDIHDATDDFARLPVHSMTEETSVAEFFHIAQLAGADFKAERCTIKLTSADDNSRAGVLSAAERSRVTQVQDEHRHLVKIPRRPRWDTSMTAEQLDQLERDSFFDWRRGLAKLEQTEHITLTPYEKNLEFWRQLWRVVERSDILVQIVDARQPLLFRCEDLEQYVHEVSPAKMNLLLVNKADYLTVEQRTAWSCYFAETGVRALFWSAKLSEELLGSGSRDLVLPHRAGTGSEEESAHCNSDEIHDDVADRCQKQLSLTSPPRLSIDTTTAFSDPDGQHAVVSSIPENGELVCMEDLIQLFRTLHTGTKVNPGCTTVGLIGYPNVGKSTTLNALFGRKKSSVSATPGHTKHFQTLKVAPDLVLCDCPGLVMPTLVYTKAELVVAGILPIDQMRDCLPPVAVICQQFPRTTFEQLYGIHVPNPKEGESPDRPCTARELLAAYAYMHGLMTANGNPNCDRAARKILKDYVSGRLLYRHPPPGTSPTDFSSAGDLPQHKLTSHHHSVNKSGTQELAPLDTISDFDREFFGLSKPVAGFGVRGMQPADPHALANPSTHQSAASRQFAEDDVSSVATETTGSIGCSDKPWRRHRNRNKREKLRRVFAHLDKHPAE